MRPPSALLGSLLCAACFPVDEGTEPPASRLYFPVGVALSAAGERLYLANSNFDLQYDAGTLQVLDTGAIRERLPVPCQTDADCPGSGRCAAPGDDSAAAGLCSSSSGDVCGGLPTPTRNEQSRAPALCGPLPLTDVLLDSARIAPFVTDLRYTLFLDRRGRERARLLLPVRGDATLHWADVENDVAGTGPLLDCGQPRGGACDDDHRRGDRAAEGQLPEERAPTEPFSVAVSGDGRAVVVAHQQRGIVSLFENTDGGPELQFVLDGLPLNPMGLAAVPPPLFARASGSDYQPGFLVSYRFGFSGIPTLELLRYFDADAAAPARPFLQRARSSPISAATSGADSRGLAIDDGERTRCEATCEAACGSIPPSAEDVPDSCVDCLADCAKLPISVYVANRSPDALLSGQTGAIHGSTFRDDVPNISDTEPLRGGPSRVYVGDVLDERGEAARRVFVVAFDSRLLYIFDPATRVIEKRIQTGRGPHALAVDSLRGLGYLAHFTDSYVGVLDLDKRHPTYGQFLLSVGEPTPPRASR